MIADSGLLISEILPGAPDDSVKAVKSMGLEGVIAKRRRVCVLAGRALRRLGQGSL